MSDDDAGRENWFSLKLRFLMALCEKITPASSRGHELLNPSTAEPSERLLHMYAKWRGDGDMTIALFIHSLSIRSSRALKNNIPLSFSLQQAEEKKENRKIAFHPPKAPKKNISAWLLIEQMGWDGSRESSTSCLLLAGTPPHQKWPTFDSKQLED